MKSIYSLSQLGWKPYFQHQLSLDDLEHHAIARVAVVERSELSLLTEALSPITFCFTGDAVNDGRRLVTAGCR